MGETKKSGRARAVGKGKTKRGVLRTISDVTCDGCGIVRQLESQEMLVSDAGSINCPECGDELIAWNGTVMYSLVTKPAS